MDIRIVNYPFWASLSTNTMRIYFGKQTSPS